MTECASSCVDFLPSPYSNPRACSRQRFCLGEKTRRRVSASAASAARAEPRLRRKAAGSALRGRLPLTTIFEAPSTSHQCPASPHQLTRDLSAARRQPGSLQALSALLRPACTSSPQTEPPTLSVSPQRPPALSRAPARLPSRNPPLLQAPSAEPHLPLHRRSPAPPSRQDPLGG